MKSVTKYLRLLPAVVIVGTGLLAIKGVDLARAATAASSSEYGEPDNSGLAPSDNGGAPVTKDFASDDGASGSASEVDVLSSLTRRRAELDARERALNMRENLLTAGEGRVDQKIGALKTLQTQIQGLLTQRDAKQDAQIASLVKTYSTMKPKDAARIFNTLADDVLLPVAKGMKSDILAPVLAAMNADAAQKLTVKLAALLKLPETPSTVCPDPAAALTPAGTTADITSPAVTTDANPPVTTAALTNPTVTPLPTPPVVTPAPAPTTTAPPPAQTPAPAPAKPTQAAATPPKPHTAAPHPAKPVAPAKPTATTAPAHPATAAATPPAKPVTTPTVTPTPATTPPAKPTTQAAATPAAPAPTTAPPASGPPTPLTPAHGG